MKEEIEFLGIITARGGSKTIPRKNIKKLAGIPLIQYTIDAVLESKRLNRCILSTDDPEIATYCSQKGIEVPFLRPKELASDTAKSIDVIIHALNYLEEKEDYKPDFILIFQPTSPLRQSEDIDLSINKFLNCPNCDSLVSVVEIPHNFHPKKIMKLENNRFLRSYSNDLIIKRRQEMDVLYARNGAAIYISCYNLIKNKKRIIGDNCIGYIMSKERSIDIDDEYDWKIAELLIKNE